MQQNDTNRNMILAIVLSVVVLFGWQFFVASPQLEQAQRRAAIEQQEQAAQKAAADAALNAPSVDGQTATAAAPVINNGVTQAFPDRQAAIAASPRAKIDTPSLSGSISLTGGRIDDLQLKKYHETVDDSSPIITLLTPDGAPNGYFVEQGWAAAAGSTVAAPLLLVIGYVILIPLGSIL